MYFDAIASKSLRTVRLLASYYLGLFFLQDVVEVLLRHRANAMAKDRQWQTPLHVAAASNSVDCVAALKGHIRNANLTDRLGRTPLHYAAVAGHVDVVKEMLDNWTCDVNSRDKKECR